MLLASTLHHTQWTLHQTILAFCNQQNLDQLYVCLESNIALQQLKKKKKKNNMVTYKTFISKVFIHQMQVLKMRQSTFFQLTPCFSIDSGMIIRFSMLCIVGSSEFDSTRNGAQQNSTVALQSYRHTTSSSANWSESKARKKGAPSLLPQHDCVIFIIPHKRHDFFCRNISNKLVVR